MLVLGVYIPCNIVGINRRFGGTYCLQLQFLPRDGCGSFLRNVG